MDLCLQSKQILTQYLFGMWDQFRLENRTVDRDRIMIVGDMDIDIKAGKLAGIKTCAVTYGMGKKDSIIKSDPDFVINSIKYIIQ